jgi:hypothetical protein
MDELELKSGKIVDEFGDGAMLMVMKAFDRAGTKWYRFGAIKCKELWYLSGPSSPRYGLSTDEFITWMMRGSRLAPMPRIFWAKFVDEI